MPSCTISGVPRVRRTQSVKAKPLEKTTKRDKMKKIARQDEEDT